MSMDLLDENPIHRHLLTMLLCEFTEMRYTYRAYVRAIEYMHDGKNWKREEREFVDQNVDGKNGE